MPPCPGSPEFSWNAVKNWTNCFGTYTSTGANGNKYVGEWKDGKRHGQGSMTMGAETKWSGNNYSGDFKSNIANGYGTYTFANGDKYVGEFKNSRFHGKGIKTFTDGRVQEGIWENFVFQYAQKVTPTVVATQTPPTQPTTTQAPSVQSTTTQTPFVKPEIDFTKKRIALVVGNANYNVRPLDNPVRDVRLIGNVLKQYGFRVILVEDANYRKFRKALARFGEELRIAGPKTTAFFYYSGHGMQYQGNNYLIPIGSEVNSVVDLDLEFVRAGRVQSAMGSITTGVKIMLLDACRNSPFKSFVRSKRSGLAQMDAPKGTIIGYATSPGKVAMDGKGRNSPYALGLVRAIKMPGLTIEAVLKQTLNWVDDMTNGKQIPWYSSSLRGDFYFNKN